MYWKNDQADKLQTMYMSKSCSLFIVLYIETNVIHNELYILTKRGGSVREWKVTLIVVYAHCYGTLTSGCTYAQTILSIKQPELYIMKRYQIRFFNFQIKILIDHSLAKADNQVLYTYNSVPHHFLLSCKISRQFDQQSLCNCSIKNFNLAFK